MLVAADGLTTPLTPFTDDRGQLDSALRDLRSSSSAVDIATALSFGGRAQGWPGGARGEIVYIGPQLSERDATIAGNSRLRVINVDADRENCGIVQLSAQQVDQEANTWQALIRIRNYGTHSQTLRLDVHFGGTAFAARHLVIREGEEVSAQYTFTTRSAGELTASISPGGSLASDDRATVFLPQDEIVRVAVYTDRPQVLRPLVEANHRLQAVFFRPAQYSPKPSASIAILDRMGAAAAPELPALWIDPPGDRSPLPVAKSVADAAVNWNSGSAIGPALRAKSLHVATANVFQLFAGDAAVASTPQGPVAVTRAAQAKPKAAVIGFDPASSELRYEVSTPLLFADLLQWLDPRAFEVFNESAQQVGLLTISLEASERQGRLQVSGDGGAAIPFTRRGDTLELFVARPTTVRVASANRERVIELRLPSIGDRTWRVPPGSRTGLPTLANFTPAARDLWKWFALAGGAGLLLEWILYGGPRRSRKSKAQIRRAASRPLDRERELAAK
jgi:hypothetical protein